MQNRPVSHRAIVLFSCLVAALVLAAGCGSSSSSKSSTASDAKSASGGSTSSTSTAAASGKCTADSASKLQFPKEPPMKVTAKQTYTATLVTNKGTMDVELLPAEAPHAVNNFVFLAKQGFYDCVPFHRIIKDFMVQTGDPEGTGTGGPGYTIQDDKVSMPYDRGVVAMANTGSPNTGGSQFFIVHGTDVNNTLGPTYPIFGKVTKGLDVLDDIAATPVEASASGEPSQPTDPVWLESVKITGP